MAFQSAEQQVEHASVRLEAPWESTDDVEHMQSVRLRRMIAMCAERHTWYAARFADEGIDPGEIGTVRDLARLAPTTKQTFIENSEAFRLTADPAAPAGHILADVTYTAGTTTGTPTPIYQTAHDLRGILFAQLRMARIRGMRRGDRVANLYPLAPFPHGGWVRPTQAAAVLGAPVVATTGGTSIGGFPVTRRFAEVVDLVVDTDPTVVWGIPSYVDRVLRHIVDTGRRAPSLRMIAVSGEPCDDARRASLIDLASRAGAGPTFVSDSLGASELQFSLVECPDGGGFHNPAPELAHVEVIDDTTGEPVPDGTPGRLAYTHLDRRGTVLLRFLVGDRAVMDRSPCPNCGWLGGRVVEHLGREGGLVKVRGNLVNIAAVDAAVTRTAGVVDHRIEIDTKAGLDAMIITVALEQRDDDGAITDSIVDAVRRSTGVRPDVRHASPDEIWSPDQRMKPMRFVDHRTRD